MLYLLNMLRQRDQAEIEGVNIDMGSLKESTSVSYKIYTAHLFCQVSFEVFQG